ncbi:MAG: hypothetical protein KJ573_16145 [Proteobacteria bacterium]|nr:hypothetical protein [Pseudomonadota bacterium]
MLVKGGTSLPREKGGILLIQLGDICDAVLTIPTVRALRQHCWENLHRRTPGAVLKACSLFVGVDTAAFTVDSNLSIL